MAIVIVPLLKAPKVIVLIVFSQKVKGRVESASVVGYVDAFSSPSLGCETVVKMPRTRK